MKIFYVLPLLNFLPVFADSGLDQLKISFSDIRQRATKEFEKAAEMKLQPFVVIKDGQLITKDDCEEIKNKIRPNYAIDPFEFTFSNGTIWSDICSDQPDAIYRRITPAFEKVTNLGLPYAFVLQVESNARGPWVWSGHLILNVFIDETNHIVEEQSFRFYEYTGEIHEYSISSLDQEGNVYISSISKHYTSKDSQIEDGTLLVQEFITADGSFPKPLFRSTLKHKTDPSFDFTKLYFVRADKKDWDNFVMPITYAWSGGFYTYGDKILDWPHVPFTSTLFIKYRGDKELCAIGDIYTGETSSKFPDDNSSYDACLNTH